MSETAWARLRRIATFLFIGAIETCLLTYLLLLMMYSPSAAFQRSSNAWPWMNLNSYFSILLPCLSEIIQTCCLLNGVGVHWGVTRDRPSLQHVRCARCTLWLSTKEQRHTCEFSQLSLHILFSTTIRLRWRLLMMTAVIESDYVTYRSALNMWSDWFFLVLRACHFLTDNSLHSADKDQRKSRAVAEKPHDAFKNSIRMEIYSGIARSTLR